MNVRGLVPRIFSYTLASQIGVVLFKCYCKIMHTYHSRIIPVGVAEVSQIFLRDTHVLQKLVS
jgi:hypothetical protein